MKKQITFGTIENQGDDFLRYSRNLTVPERLKYMQLLRKRAYGQSYDTAIDLYQKKSKKKKEILVFSALEGEPLVDFYSRLNKFKLNGYF